MPGLPDGAQNATFRAKVGIHGADGHLCLFGDGFDGGANVSPFQEQRLGSRDDQATGGLSLPLAQGGFELPLDICHLL